MVSFTNMLVNGSLAAIAGFIIYALAVFAIRKYKYREFPSPFVLPILGNLWDTEAPKLIIYLRKQNKVLGNMFTFWPGMSPYLVITDRAAAREVLSDTKVFIKGSDYTEKFHLAFGDGLVTSNGEAHKEGRACLGKFFIKTAIDTKIDMMVSECTRMMDEDFEPHLNEDIDVQHFFHILALRVFGQLCVSVDYGAPENVKLAESINHGVKRGSNVVGEHIVMNLPMSRIFPGVRRVIEICKYIDNHMDDVIEERLNAMHRGESTPDDILAALLAEALPREKMHDHLRTLLCAGHDTTAFFGCYMAFLLSQHPAVQDKVKAELKKVLGDRTDINPADIAELKYCRMVMQETLRLYTVIPFVNRTSVKDHVLKESGKTIPKGTVCLVPLGIMARDGEVWEDPNAFKPERFANITGHTSAKHGYLPFGYGSRTCVGNTLALTEGIVMLSLLMQRYRFLPVKDFKPKVIAGISLVSRNGILVRVVADSGYSAAAPSSGQP
jgi:cytochrome P450